MRAPGPVIAAAWSSFWERVSTASLIGWMRVVRLIVAMFWRAWLTAVSAFCRRGEIRSMGSMLIAPFVGANCAGCMVCAMSVRDGMTSVARELTVSVTCRMASRFAPMTGVAVAAR